MIPIRRCSVGNLVFCAAVLAVAASDPPAVAAPPAVDPGTPVAESSAAPTVRENRRLTPFARELRQATDAQRAALVALQARFAQAANEAEALAIQREIETTKRNGEIEILRIQAKHARLKGREPAARRIEAAIEEILHPAAAPRTAPRPVRDEGRDGAR